LIIPLKLKKIKLKKSKNISIFRNKDQKRIEKKMPVSRFEVVNKYMHETKKSIEYYDKIKNNFLKLQI
jgi:hypothetical protein